MDKTIWTTKCRQCEKEYHVTTHGIFEPMGFYYSELLMLCHVIHCHPSVFTWKSFWQVLFELIKMILTFALCLVHGVSYVFYPLYWVLNKIFG